MGGRVCVRTRVCAFPFVRLCLYAYVIMREFVRAVHA